MKILDRRYKSLKNWKIKVAFGFIRTKEASHFYHSVVLKHSMIITDEKLKLFSMRNKSPLNAPKILYYKTFHSQTLEVFSKS